ncbi:MAG: hypothetical protein OXC40_04625 [Proteobacteria bacterium]|nr:hypothetical protein [Pseudomonadota bacterium]
MEKRILLRWFETSTLYLYEILYQKKALNLESFENCWISLEELGVFELNKVKPRALSFQSGYLTIVNKARKRRNIRYQLTYLNVEVGDGVCRKLLSFLDMDIDQEEMLCGADRLVILRYSQVA